MGTRIEIETLPDYALTELVGSARNARDVLERAEKLAVAMNAAPLDDANGPEWTAIEVLGVALLNGLTKMEKDAKAK